MADFADLLDRTVTIRRRTVAEGDFGASQTKSWSDSTTGVKMAIQPASSSDRLLGGQVTQQETHVGYCASSVDVKGRDQVRDGTIDYDVLGPAQDHSQISISMQRVLLRHREES